MPMNANRSLRVALAKRDMNQTQLAQLAGLTQPSISGLASRQNWNCESLQKIADAFGMKVSEFVALGED